MSLPLWILSQDEEAKGDSNPILEPPDNLVWLLRLMGMVPMIFLGITLWFSDE